MPYDYAALLKEVEEIEKEKKEVKKEKKETKKIIKKEKEIARIERKLKGKAPRPQKREKLMKQAEKAALIVTKLNADELKTIEEEFKETLIIKSLAVATHDFKEKQLADFLIKIEEEMKLIEERLAKAIKMQVYYTKYAEYHKKTLEKEHIAEGTAGEYAQRIEQGEALLRQLEEKKEEVLNRMEALEKEKLAAERKHREIQRKADKAIAKWEKVEPQAAAQLNLAKAELKKEKSTSDPSQALSAAMAGLAAMKRAEEKTTTSTGKKIAKEAETRTKELVKRLQELKKL